MSEFATMRLPAERSVVAPDGSDVRLLLGLSGGGMALVDQFYAEVQQMGGGRWDTSSLVRRLQPRPKIGSGV